MRLKSELKYFCVQITFCQKMMNWKTTLTHLECRTTLILGLFNILLLVKDTYFSIYKYIQIKQ